MEARLDTDFIDYAILVLAEADRARPMGAAPRGVDAAPLASHERGRGTGSDGTRGSGNGGAGRQ